MVPQISADVQAPPTTRNTAIVQSAMRPAAPSSVLEITSTIHPLIQSLDPETTNTILPGLRFSVSLLTLLLFPSPCNSRDDTGSFLLTQPLQVSQPVRHPITNARRARVTSSGSINSFDASFEILYTT